MLLFYNSSSAHVFRDVVDSWPCGAGQPVDDHFQLHWQLLLDALLFPAARRVVHLPLVAPEQGRAHVSAVAVALAAVMVWVVGS